MFKINIGGVPEHFNYPWLKCIENGGFKSIELDVNWKNYPGGTGEMAEALDQKDIDIAIMLSEGSIKEIESGKDFKIIQKYIETPLLWGIHVDTNSPFESIKDLKEKTASISRYNSGSHLMTYVLAERESWDLESLKFELCKNLDGSIEALKQKKADFLLWERFTTKPYVDNQTLRHLGDCPTPWPCFVIVCQNKFYNKNQKQIDTLLKVINTETSQLKTSEELPEILSKRYHIHKKDIKEWLAKTEWSQSPMKEETISNLKNKLKAYSIIS